MVLTREEKERLVLDLYNQRTPIRNIAREAGMSFRDIGRIIDKKEKEKETIEVQVQQITQSTQAYKLFSDGKSPIQVAIALNLRQPQVTEFYTEHWKLNGLYMLDQIYGEIKDDIGYFVNLYELAKAAGMNVQHVNRLLEIANNDLPAVELRYERLKREAATLEFDRANSARDFQQLNEHLIMMRKTRDSVRLDYEKEMDRLRYLQQQRMKLEAGVRHFENNNEEYAKIKKTVEEKVRSILSDQKMVLKLGLLSLIESMRKEPDKYSQVIYHNTSSAANYNSQDYVAASYGQQQQQYPSHAYTDMLLEEAEKLYNKLAKELGDEIVSDHAYSTSSSSLLPLLPPTEERQSHPTTTTAATNQTHTHTEEHRVSQSEIKDDD
jgi:hypothetical protein